MTAPADSRRTLWGLLGLWVGLELLFASRWWTATPSPPPPAETGDGAALRELLAQERRPDVWFAPYTTFPETGMVESRNRSGVYDTFLAFPAGKGLAANYGAAKLTPADTLFSLASSLGLGAELHLARLLGNSFFALDTGALTDPAAGVALCRTTPGCRLSGDGYALFSLNQPAAASAALVTALGKLERNITQLPYKSSGPSWGPLVFHPFQWEWAGWDPAKQQIRIKARAVNELQIYRYPLERFPAVTRPWLTLAPDDVELVLPPDVQGVRICLLPPGVNRCELVILLPDQKRVPIGDRLRPGGITRLRLEQVATGNPAASYFSPLTVEIRASAASLALLGKPQ